jgi:pyruvate kinase
MRDICAEAEAFLKSRTETSRGRPPSVAFTDAVTEAAVDGACLMARRLDAALIVVSADSGWTALALSNRRPDAAVLALCRTPRGERTELRSARVTEKAPARLAAELARLDFFTP